MYPIFIVSSEIIKKTIITKATIASIEEDFFISFPENLHIHQFLVYHGQLSQ